MHLARRTLRVATSLSALSALTIALCTTAHADRLPLVGTAGSGGAHVSSSVVPSQGNIITIDPQVVPCTQIADFEDVVGGTNPGTNYDGILISGGLKFAERFAGQTLGANGDFDVVSGTPSGPLTLQAGAPGQNLDVFTYVSNVLTGLGPVGFPDLDAIGEGSIAVYFQAPQSMVSFAIVGGNGGSATLSFYRTDGSLIDDVVVTGLADLSYGFATADASPSIAGILIQTTDPSGIGVDDICHNGGIVGTRPMTWGRIKTLYR